MFFFISKIIHFLIFPIVWIIALLLLALFSKQPNRKRKFLIIAIALFYFFSNSFIIDEVYRLYEERNPTYNAITINYDVVIVLGGFTTYDNLSDLEGFYASSDRFLHGLKLYKTGKAKKIMLVGGSGSISNPTEKEGIVMGNFLKNIGIPTDDIIIEQESKNTRENAINTAHILNKIYPNGSFLLVTSGYHMPRARRCFEKANIKVTPFSVDHYAGKRKFVFDYLFIPDINALAKWQIILHEWVGFITYKVLGYI